jgi:hypothetical protein
METLLLPISKKADLLTPSDRSAFTEHSKQNNNSLTPGRSGQFEQARIGLKQWLSLGDLSFGRGFCGGYFSIVNEIVFIFQDYSDFRFSTLTDNF